MQTPYNVMQIGTKKCVCGEPWHILAKATVATRLHLRPYPLW